MSTAPQIRAFDHLVLTVRDIAATCQFYQQVLGMQVQQFEDGRTALHFGSAKINLHQAGHEIEPNAQHPLPGSADVCLVTTSPMHAVIAHLEACAVAIVLGPVVRTGAQGMMISVYLRDPDQNLIELASYDDYHAAS